MDTWGRPAECGRGHQEPREALPALPTLEDTSATSTAWIWGRAGRAEKGHSLHCTQGTGALTASHRAAAVPPNAGAGGATRTAEGAQVCPADQSRRGAPALP